MVKTLHGLKVLGQQAFAAELKRRPLEQEKRRAEKIGLPTPGTPVVLLVSGGIDSTVLWEWLLKELKLKVYPLFINEPHTLGNGWGSQKAVRYFDRYFAHKYPGLSRKVKTLTMQPVSSGIINEWKRKGPAFFHPAYLLKNYYHEKLLFKLVPNDNFVLPLSGLEYCRYLRYRYNLEVKTILVGVNASDGLTVAGQTLAQLSFMNRWLKMTANDKDFHYFAPFFNQDLGTFMEKAGVVALGLKNGLPLEKTWSCNEGILFACGRCNACLQRQPLLNRRMKAKQPGKIGAGWDTLHLHWGLKRRLDLIIHQAKNRVEQALVRLG